MNRSKRKLCVITATRAEYGWLRPLIKEIDNSEKFVLQLLVTGTHLSQKHGFTINEIEKDGFKIDYKIDMKISNDSNHSTSLSLSRLITQLSRQFKKLSPELIILSGDRFELLAIALTATIHRIPIAHLNGGELTEGAFDDNIRHSITKLSHLHFVSTETYRNRVTQLGENPKNVFNIGSLGIDAIKNFKLLKRDQLENSLGIELLKKNLLITYHPLTNYSNQESQKEITAIINALSKFKKIVQIFTMPNADPGNNAIYQIINSYVKENKNVFFFKSLGHLRYLSLLSQVDGVIGNSSSGITEAPFFKIGTINVGDRQKGRLISKSILNCKGECDLIIESINKIYSSEFQLLLNSQQNYNSVSESSIKLIKILENTNFKSLLIKKFNDLEISN